MEKPSSQIYTYTAANTVYALAWSVRSDLNCGWPVLRSCHDHAETCSWTAPSLLYLVTSYCKKIINKLLLTCRHNPQVARSLVSDQQSHVLQQRAIWHPQLPLRVVTVYARGAGSPRQAMPLRGWLVPGAGPELHRHCSMCAAASLPQLAKPCMGIDRTPWCFLITRLRRSWLDSCCAGTQL